jgi:hypothetical protein
VKKNVNTFTLFTSLGVVDPFMMVKAKGTPVCPTKTGEGTVGTSEPPTPANDCPALIIKQSEMNARARSIHRIMLLLFTFHPFHFKIMKQNQGKGEKFFNFSPLST